MVSTYINYNLVSRDLQKSMTKVSQQAAVSKDSAYYKANIGKVTSVDDLLNDHRLYTYATKAYGLEDMAYAKAFIRKVLESNLSDANSFANKLSDKRYREFAAAFPFGTASADTKTAQSANQIDDMIGLYTAVAKRGVDALDANKNYYNLTIGKITNVNALLADDKLRDYVFSAYGIDKSNWSHDTISKVLGSDPSDPNSYVNSVWVSQKDDINANITKAQAAMADAASKIDAYTAQLKEPGADMADLRRKIDLERARGSMNEISIVSYRKALETIDSYVALASAFQFASDGTLPAGTDPQTAAQQSDTHAKYVNSQGAVYLAADPSYSESLIKQYRAGLAKVTTVDQFLKTPNVFNFALKSFGIDPETVSPTIIKNVLKSDPNDPKSYVNKLKDDRFVQLARAFNFDSSGNVTTPVVAQDGAEVKLVMKDYIIAKTRFTKDKEQAELRKAADKDAVYYQNTIANIGSVKELLADRKLMDIALVARGLDPAKVTTADLRKMFDSDLTDPKSFVNTQTDPRFAELVASFNFDNDGEVARLPKFGPQTRDQFMETQRKYLQQTLETQQGETNPGVRLALYFERKAPGITSAYDLLADKALAEVFRTTFGLPDEVGAMDIDQQAKVVEKHLNLKDLADPAKLAKLLNRFSALYDIKNGTGVASSPVITLYQGGGLLSNTAFAAVAKTAR
ncbi:DUF1217 domain-containing protein [Rhodopseudomonas boonkerdii]|uniref:DUF1217 domain-containing protein n=1 Tax=Rhodopseudomonas boonkerdii TaxID=475937 RepID=UPI001E5D8E85|nr:DUF1217 domain-containing protein [Rhodopseudomonas boonkerdii]UGV26195.1 DUF1217 domain-containing protein [Rhodopseudomonas boonkerdii]